jgi:CheY-like chemotaxis protein
VKFTPSGGKVRVHLVQSDSHCILTVSDTGIGIEGSFLPHVFDRFRQADGTTTREHQGLGLGLAIVKELVELHGGTVRASSEGLGKGATLSVTLPSLSGHEWPGRDEGTRGAESEPLLAGITVLAVDDDLDTLEVLGSALRSAGAGVRLASSGAEAVDLWQQAPSDILLCDLGMPHMDGFAVLSSIRRLEAGSGDAAPALALTAYASEESRVQCLDAGFEGRITKPYDATQLVRSVAQAVGRLPVPQR